MKRINAKLFKRVARLLILPLISIYLDPKEIVIIFN